MKRSIDVIGEAFAIRFDYDPLLVADIRSIPGRQWSSADRCWYAPLTSVRTVVEYGRKHDFRLAAEVQTVPDAEPPLGPTVAIEDHAFSITFDYDRNLLARVKELPGCRWNPKRKAWRVDLDASSSVSDFVIATGAIVDHSADDVLDETREALERIIASSAADADFDVPGLGGVLLPFQRAGVAYALRALGRLPAPEPANGAGYPTTGTG